ncbi:chloride channel protein [Desulfohalovibrio reitneri]|uniref:chloride channel protein n=1 Tax=Desulfohalovibrio reitneri TaxID=1307759 RepID=UPI0004A7318C|nr:chloride channel protein [Desulfohalovibrio reitneri]
MSPLGRHIRLWREFLRSYRQISSVRWLVLGIGVGVASGLGAVLFYLGVEHGKHFILTTLAGFELPAPAGERLVHGGHTGDFRPWIVPVALCAIGLLTGWLVQRFIPETKDAGTDGTDAMINSFHNQEGRIRPRTPIIKGLMAILTISGGGSAGQEGPISQIGAGVGSFLATRLGLSVRERRIMLLAGAAGGLGAIFRAPLGGALTAIEVIYTEDFEAEAILPSVLSSVVAYTIFTLFYGTEPIFGIPSFQFENPLELPFYAILAVATSAVGWFYVRAFYFIKFSIFHRVRAKVGLMWTAGLGGLCMGAFGVFFPHVLTGGYGWLEMAIFGQLPLMLMLAIILGKTVATSMTIGSGMSGGMFAPALFVGGMTGGMVGKLAHIRYPHIVGEPGAYVLVGMAAFFAGVANAPIGPLIMVTEITQGYGLLAPLMLASALALVLCRRTSLYEHQVENKFESPAHVNDATINILEELQVKDFYKKGRVTVLEESMNLKVLTHIIANTNELFFPVRGDDDRISGILTLQDVRKVLYEDALFELIVARDLMRKPAFLYPNDDLYTALLQFVDTDYGQIPVIDPDDATDVLGIINRHDVFQAYSQTIRRLKEE